MITSLRLRLTLLRLLSWHQRARLLLRWPPRWESVMTRFTAGNGKAKNFVKR